MKASFVQDNIHVTFIGPLWAVVLCKLGLHRWTYWHMAPEFIKAFPGVNVCRHCTRCTFCQMTDDGHTWHGRV
jgi:hypothetical protein